MHDIALRVGVAAALLAQALMPTAVRDTTDRRKLGTAERRLLLLLGVPSLVLALSTTIVTTYLPVHLRAGHASTVVIGSLIGIEGFMAIGVPLIIGPWSDRLRTRFGSRLPFVIAATPLLVGSLVLLGFVQRVGVAAIVLVAFFGAYFTAYEPYRALYPDLVDDKIAGRAQSTQALSRGAGTFLALVGGGLLITIADPVPFLAAGLLAAAGLIGFVVTAARRRWRADETSGTMPGTSARQLWGIVRERRALRLFLIANALWELSLGALKTFAVLYLTVGLGFGVATASLIIGGVALLLVVATALSGKLGDRLGRARVLQWALAVYGLGLLLAFLTASTVAVAAAAPVIAFGGGVVMTLPYAVLMPLMEDSEHGAITGLYSASRGVGTAAGPLLAGVAITTSSDLFRSTQGYQATWGICAAAVLLSIVPLRKLRHATEGAPG